MPAPSPNRHAKEGRGHMTSISFIFSLLLCGSICWDPGISSPTLCKGEDGPLGQGAVAPVPLGTDLQGYLSIGDSGCCTFTKDVTAPVTNLPQLSPLSLPRETNSCPVCRRGPRPPSMTVSGIAQRMEDAFDSRKLFLNFVLDIPLKNLRSEQWETQTNPADLL